MIDLEKYHLGPVSLHKARQWLNRHHIWGGSFIKLLLRVVFTCSIHPHTEIGEGTSLRHGGFCILIGGNTKIGKNVRINTHVILGTNGVSKGFPTIEDNVLIGAGARILGPVVIGKNSVIGANSVVTKDIPPFSLAAGIPAQIIKSNINSEDYKFQFPT